MDSLSGDCSQCPMIEPWRYCAIIPVTFDIGQPRVVRRRRESLCGYDRPATQPGCRHQGLPLHRYGTGAGRCLHLRHPLPALRYSQGAAAEDPQKPIFTFQHHHLQDTVYVSHDWYTASSGQIKSIFNRCSQVINFSGHSHGPINSPTSIWQGRFTALGTGTLSYFEMEPGMTDGVFPTGYQDAAQFYIVEVDATNHVRILPYNLLTDDFFRTPANTDDPEEALVYDIVAPSDRDTFLYGSDRKQNATAPAFAEGAAVEILAAGTNTVELKVPMALDDQCLYGYDMAFEAEDGTTVTYKAFYDFYREPMPTEMTYTAKGLKDNTTYTVTVYPVNCFGRRGEQGITATLTTKEVVRYDYASTHPVNFVGTFTNFDAMTELIRSNNTYAYGGTVDGDIFGGDWQSNASSNATQFPANAYLRVWVDFTDVEFRKMNLGFISPSGGLYTTDEGDNRSDQAFYYLPEGETEWQSFVHGNDGCFGEAQATPVMGYKGWLAFPVKDFLYRSATGSDGASQGTPYTAYELAGIYVFWDYADSASYTNAHFCIDELQIVEDYTVFEAYQAP